MRRKVSLVLEQMQPLVVSGLLMVEGGGRLRASCASGSGCGLISFPTVSLADDFSWFC